MNTSRRHARRYLIPTWLLWLVALAGVVGLLLTDPVASVGAPLEEFPPPLPLDELPPTGVDPSLQLWISIGSLVLGAAAFAYAYLELCTDAPVLERVRARLRRTV